MTTGDQSFTDAFEAMYPDDPAKAQNARLRATVIIALEDFMAARKLTQTQAAAIFGVTQPRLSDLMRGKVSKFTLDALTDMATRAGIEIGIRLRQPAMQAKAKRGPAARTPAAA